MTDEEMANESELKDLMTIQKSEATLFLRRNMTLTELVDMTLRDAKESAELMLAGGEIDHGEAEALMRQLDREAGALSGHTAAKLPLMDLLGPDPLVIGDEGTRPNPPLCSMAAWAAKEDPDACGRDVREGNMQHDL